jgi:type I restriction enzyme M protein
MDSAKTLRTLLAEMAFTHPLNTLGMRDCQVEGITGLEQSLASDLPRALIQMATGSGKTFTACAFTYRLIKFAKAKRVLFLVDRANLGRQAKTEFDQYVLPDDGRKFTAVYNVQHLTSNKLDDVCRVTICTIQRLYSMLRGEELPEDVDERSGFEIAAAMQGGNSGSGVPPLLPTTAQKTPSENPTHLGSSDPKRQDAASTLEVAYNPAIPIETFDFIVTDECHRSIYGLWRQVLEYFDAHLIGLTATPSKQTIGFFNQNLVMEYGHERAVADGVNVGYEVYRIRTRVTEAGDKVEKGFYVDRRHKETRRRRWERLDEDLAFTEKELDRSVVVPSQKGGAGQYFTPRSLIAAMVEVVAPQPGETICDPSCGTGGFLLAAHDYIAKHHQLDREQKKQLKSGTFYGIELVDSVTRLCAMNLLLHGIGDGGSGVSPLDPNDKRQDAASTFDLPVITKDALAGKHGEYEIILANPPFGKKSSVTIVNDAGESSKESLVINRDDFWASTSNKQLNFLQHIFTILKMHGRAAVVLPDNVLFEGGAGETIRRELLKQADVHTLLRLPTGIFYAQGVKANVLFFDRKPAQEKPWTKKLWIYDLRTNMHFTLKENPLKREHLQDFVDCYFGRSGSSGSGVPPLGVESEKKRRDAASTSTSRHNRKETERFKSFDYDDLIKRDKINLDIFWLKDDALEESANLPAPGVIAQDIMEDLQAALEQFATIAEDLKIEV